MAAGVKEFSSGADDFTAIFFLALRLLMSLPGMIVQDTQPSSLLPLPSLPDEPDEAAPASAFAQLLNMFLLPPPVADVAPPASADSAASAELSMLPAGAPASANDPANLVGAEVIRQDETSLSVSALPELATSAPSAVTSGDSFTVPQTLSEPVLEAGQNAASAAMLQESGDTQSTDAADAPPVTTARRPRLDDELPANDIAETDAATTPQMTLPQSLVSVSLPGIFEASAKSALAIQAPQIGSSPSEFSGRAASETGAAMDAQAVARLNVASKELPSERPADLPTAAMKPPAARLDDRYEFKVEQIVTADRVSVAPNDLSSTEVTQAQKQPDGLGRFPFTERPQEIEPGPVPDVSGEGDAVMHLGESEKSQDRVVAVSRGDAHNGAKDGWQREFHQSDAQANPSMVVGAAPARLDESQRGEASVPAWRPMVERLGRDIGEHFRVGEQQAVLQLEPAELGKVKIDLRIEDGQLHVRIVAEGHESQGLIEHHLPELRQALRAGQIDVGEVRVTQGEWQGSNGLAENFNQSPQGRQESPRGFASAAVGDEAMTEHLPQPVRSADGRVSMWA